MKVRSKKMKKKLMSILLCILLCLFLTSCGDSNQTGSEKESDLSQDKIINLNDNVYYYTDIQLTDKDCGGFGFPTNVESIIDEKWISSYDNLKSVDKIELLSHDDIIYDEEKEKATEKEWNKLEKPKRGVANYSIGYDNHEFYFGYWYISLLKDEEGTAFSQEDEYYELSKNIDSEINSFKEKAYSIIKEKDGYRFQGTCGGPATEILLLDETVCDKYNLSCDRW